MADDVAAQQALPKLSDYGKDGNIRWKRIEGGDAFDYPIDYWIAPLACHVEEGRAEFLVKWEPNAYCHFHRHTGETTIMVVEGEHHVIEESFAETIHKIRRPGHLTRNPPGDVHMEKGGPSGSVLFFSMKSKDGKLFDLLDRNDQVLRSISVRDLATGNY